MGLEAITQTGDGRLIVPTSDDDWQDWVSAIATRNYAIGDPVLDWLDLFGEANGFQRDATFRQYDSRTDFTKFIFEQARRFEAAVVSLLRQSHRVERICSETDDPRDLAKAEETFAAILRGAKIIHQGILRDPQHRTYGVPNLLVRSDVLRSLFPGALTDEEASIPAPDLRGGKWHYRVVDVKFRTLRLLVNGELDNSGSAPAYKLALFIYNRALARLQGLAPPASYLLGRGWTQKDNRGSSCLDRLATVPQAGTLARGPPIVRAVEEAVEWVRRVRTQGARWQVLPQPSVPELFPNISNAEDGPWYFSKKRIVDQLEDLSLLWQVGIPGRRKAHAAALYRWTDPRVTPELVGVTGEKRPSTLMRILEVNRKTGGTAVYPPKIRAAEEIWRSQAGAEFYVDFETVSDLADDFSRMPNKGGQTLIFMIGCGHLEQGSWSFRSFVVDDLTEEEEARIMKAWFEHMETVTQRLDPGGSPPVVIHWSPAEVTNLETAYNSAWERHGKPNWPSPKFFDFLRRVMHEEPVVVRGALAFGLKAIARAMHSHGLIETLWGDGPTDGLGAMLGAWWCQDEAKRRGRVALSQIDLMQEIAEYNEVDCRVMMEIVRYLRTHH